MDKLHKSNNADTSAIETSEGQRELLCSNKVSDSRPSLSLNTLNALEDLGDILRPIYARMMQQGYVIIDGTLVKPDQL
jgi:hypothetical protein